jgi:hypothetical protein
LIDRDIHRRAVIASGKDFKIVRLAIDAEDFKKFHLPPQQIKDTDTRAAAFRREFGQERADGGAGSAAGR